MPAVKNALAPVFVIALDETAEAPRSLLEQLIQLGFNAQCFQGVDGRTQRPELKAPEHIDETRMQAYVGMALSNSEIGCYLSHYRCVKAAFDAGLERVCIMEEDVALEDNFSTVLQSLCREENSGLEFVRLMGLKKHRRKKIKPLDATTWLTRPVKGLCGAQGYVLNRSGMEKIIHEAASIWRPIDKMYDQFWDCDLHCYAVEPHIIYEQPTPTSIQHAFKPGEVAAPAANLRRKLQRFGYKTHRSLQRRQYMMKHRKAFTPAEKVTGYYGRTSRIR